MFSNAFFTGKVRHHRRVPKAHDFSYSMGMLYLDVDSIDTVCRKSFLWSSRRFNLVRYRREDYLGSSRLLLNEAVAAKIKQEIGAEFKGRIFMLTNLRYWGYCFNPVTFYFCYNAENALEYIVAEINNTPWDERYAYVLDARSFNANEVMRFEFDKQFHISPFMPMNLRYDWQFRLSNQAIRINMACSRDEEIVFSANLRLHGKPLTTAIINMLPFRYGLMCVKVITAIYWQALRLWLKRIPFYSHPTRKKSL